MDELQTTSPHTRSVECGGDLLNKFFDNPTAEPDLSCVDEKEAPEFFVPLYTTGIATRLGLIAVEDKEALAGPTVWGAGSAFVSLFAFIYLSVAAIGRSIDKRQAVDVPCTRWVAWTAAMLAGLCGIAVIVLTIRIRMQQKLLIGTLVGFLMTGLSTVGLTSFLLYWDLSPF